MIQEGETEGGRGRNEVQVRGKETGQDRTRQTNRTKINRNEMKIH